MVSRMVGKNGGRLDPAVRRRQGLVLARDRPRDVSRNRCGKVRPRHRLAQFIADMRRLALGVLAARAGIPKGMLSIISSTHGSGIGIGVGKEFCEDPTVRKLSFTGSAEAGRKLLAQAADEVVKCSIKLGGNAPFFVVIDANIDAAVEDAIMSKSRNNGRTRVCANRVCVQDGVHGQLAERLAEALECGDVGVNTGIISTEVAPFGGVKQSGLGREGSSRGIENDHVMKYICMRI